MLRATLLNATWILLQVDVVLPSVGSLGVATTASTWENLPTTSPCANWRRYIPRGRWLASLATTDARCLTAASKDRTCGAVDSFLSYLTPRSLMFRLPPSFPVCQMLESSAYTTFSLSLMPRYLAMPLTRMMNKIGLRINPCLTPYRTSIMELVVLSQTTHCFQPVM
jgi:hypothetical protein